MKIYDDKIKKIDPLVEKLTNDDKTNLFCSNHHLDKFIKKDGNLFHVKYNKFVNILNELIGEIISEYFELQTVKSSLYKIYDNESKYCLLTNVFTEAGKKYDYINNLFPDFVSYKGIYNLYKLNKIFDETHQNIYIVKSYALNKLIIDLKKMIVRDFITNTTDRHCQNFMFYYDKSFVELMPVYDYEFSFNNGSNYFSVFKFNLDNSDIVNLIRNDDTFQELLEKAMLLRMKDIFKRLKEYPISLSFIEKCNYEKIVKEKQKEIKQYKLLK